MSGRRSSSRSGATGATTRKAGRLLIALGIAVALLTTVDSERAEASSAERFLAEFPLELSMSSLRRLDRLGFTTIDGPSAESGGFVTGLVIFEQPRATVLALLRQTDRQVEYRRELRRAEPVQRLADGSIEEYEISLFLMRLVYRVRYVEVVPDTRFEWALDDGFENDIQELTGFWEFSEFENDPGRTLGYFGSRLDIGGGLPERLRQRLNRKIVLDYLRDCRTWVDAQGE